MLIQVNTNDNQLSPAIETHVHESLEKATKNFASRVTRIEAHLHDDNGPKSSPAKRCMFEVRIAGLQPMVVEHEGPDLYTVITETAGKLERAVRRKLEKHDHD